MEKDCGPIMIVDDDASSRELLRALLEAAGYVDVLEVQTGEEALVLAGAEHPRLVLLDVALPGVSGYEVCHQLRDRFGNTLPVIFVSGARTEPHDRVAGLLIGADDYLVKPFFPGELVARVRRLLIRNGAEDAGRLVESEAIERLSEREREVLRLLAQGLSQDAIGKELFISPKTAATHIHRILTKLGVHSRAEAVAAAYREGLVGADVVAHLLA